jgi:ABC-2 type transport system permease protein
MMWRTSTATAERVLRQLQHDRRTMVMLLGVPSLLLILVHDAFDARPAVFQRTGLPLIGVFPLVSMFLVASIAMLRERRSGTLERLMALPVTKLGLLLGYAIGFAVVACAQASVTLAVGVWVLGLDVAGPMWLAVVVAIANAMLGMSMGLAVSAFANTEFQAIQFMPAFVLPQFLMCGLIVDRSEMARPLEIISNLLPLTYAYDALRAVADEPGVSSDVLIDLGISIAMTVLALGCGAATLRRRTA